MGPPLHEKRHVEAFIKKWKNNKMAVEKPFIKDGRLWVKVRRKYTDALHLIEDFLHQTNLGKNLNEIKNEMKICNGVELIKFNEFWSEYFCDKYPWER